MNYDAYFETDREKLTRNELYDIIDDFNTSWFKEMIKDSIRNIYQYYDRYFWSIESNELPYQFYIYSKINYICNNLLSIVLVDGYNESLQKQYPELLDDIKEIQQDFNNNHSNKAEELGAVKDILQYDIFDLVIHKQIFILLWKYAEYKPLKEYLDKNGSCLY
jgi:hypothetical protein